LLEQQPWLRKKMGVGGAEMNLLDAMMAQTCSVIHNIPIEDREIGDPPIDAKEIKLLKIFLIIAHRYTCIRHGAKWTQKPRR
jgi:hypothetical protein